MFVVIWKSHNTNQQLKLLPVRPDGVADAPLRGNIHIRRS